jgi:phage I-like protein
MSHILAGQLFRAYVASPLGVERDDAGRVWCQVFPTGEWARKDFPDGKLDLGPTLFGSFIANWKAAGSPPLPVDYEHKEDGPASGWIENLRIAPSGEMQAAIKWTDEAAADIKADKRRYISPTWAMAHTNRRTGAKGGPWLYGAALTNSPFFDSMPRVAASASPQTNPQQEQSMSLARIAVVLGLNPAASEDVVAASVEELKKSHASALAAAGEESTKLKAANTKAADELAKLAARNVELEKADADNKAAIFQRDFDALFEAGLKEGKSGLPAMKDTLLATAKAMGKDGLETVKKLIAGMGAVATAPAGVAGDDSSKSDLAKFEELVSAKMKAGSLKTAEAYRLVTQEHPELAAKVFPSTTSTTPPRA